VGCCNICSGHRSAATDVSTRVLHGFACSVARTRAIARQLISDAPDSGEDASMLRIIAIVVAVACVACAPTVHRVQLVNKTNRVIEEIYIYPAGAADHGASRAKLAPNASAEVTVKAGNVEVDAVSEKIRVDATSTETRRASQVIELRGPLELVFHDSNQVPPGLDRPNTRAITFRITPPPAEPEPSPEAPVESPAP
jgi:hypothetical protein